MVDVVNKKTKKMQVLIFLSFFALVLSRNVAFAQSQPLLSAAAEQWIEEKKTLVPSGLADTLRLIAFEQRDLVEYQKTNLRIFHQGRVVFGADEEVFFFVNSSHTDSIIGDITVLITKTDGCYFNKAHACGGMAIFYAPRLTMPKRLSEFLTEFKAEADESEWLRYK